MENSIDKNTHPLLIKLNNKLHNNFSSFSIYNTKGIKISSYNNSKNWFDLGFDIYNLRIYKSSILGNPTQDKNLWYSTSLKNYFVIISAPIYGSKTSNLSNFQSTIISGVVVATYSVSLLLNDITSRHADKDNIVYMLSNDGTIVYSNLINRFKKFPFQFLILQIILLDKNLMIIQYIKRSQIHQIQLRVAFIHILVTV